MQRVPLRHLFDLRKQWPFDFIRAYAVKNHVITDLYEKGIGSIGSEPGSLRLRHLPLHKRQRLSIRERRQHRQREDNDSGA